LVVTAGNDEAMAQLEGEGTVSGEEGYSFMMKAVDGGKGGVDTIQIVIWITDTDEEVFNNEVPQELGGGSIIINSKRRLRSA